MIHFTSIDNLSKSQIIEIFELTKKLKDMQKNQIEHHYLNGKTLGMIFEKSSTRTRVSFEVGMYQLGGHALFLNSSDLQLGRSETIEDTARVLSRYLDGIMIRTFSHDTVLALSENASIPVINGLSNMHHPCQALADIFTLLETGKELLNLKLAYVGDGNNIAHSLLQLCATIGIDISIATPENHKCDKTIIEQAVPSTYLSGSRIVITNDPKEAAADADAVYTDTWISMGMESEKEQRIADFKDFTITPSLMSLAKQNAVFMHCLPAYRNYEVSAEVIDGPQSVVFNQAENRLHVQKALLTLLMGDKHEYSWNLS
ncbi:MAG: ornithine carbamoyltransferase [Deltaproteobacteria bacterium]